MTQDDYIDKRKSRRFPFSKRDAVYCVVVRAKSVGTTIALSTVDFSESGFQFAIIPNMKGDFFKGEKLYLKAIVGTRNLTFAEPIELAIRWQKYEEAIDIVRIGCEICNIATEAEKQFIEFIRAEVKFKGIRIQDQSRQADDASGTEAGTVAAPRREVSRPLRVVSIYGGEKSDDPTETVLAWAEGKLESLGHPLQRINLFSRTVNGCVGAAGCGDKRRAPDCGLADDLPWITARIAASDLVIHAFPMTVNGLSFRMQALVDRLMCPQRGRADDGALQLSAGRQCQALIATTGGAFTDAPRQVTSLFQRVRESYGLIDAGSFFVCNGGMPAELGDDIRSQARRFADQLFVGPSAPYVISMPGERRQA